jgi:hypothetical protein
MLSLRTGLVVEKGQPITGGNITATPTKVGQRFHVKLQFRDDGKECCCSCCEYRQYVRGHILHNGIPTVHKLRDSDLSWEFSEDARRATSAAGTYVRYGHRDEPWNQGAVDKYENPPAGGADDRKEGCDYHAADFAKTEGLDGIGVPRHVDFVMQFMGQVIDTCNGNRIVFTDFWDVAFSYDFN